MCVDCTYEHKTCVRKTRPGLVSPVQVQMHGGVGAGICPPTSCSQGLQVGLYDTIAFQDGAGLGEQLVRLECNTDSHCIDMIYIDVHFRGTNTDIDADIKQPDLFS